jgi:hypothetical protein
VSLAVLADGRQRVRQTDQTSCAQARRDKRAGDLAVSTIIPMERTAMSLFHNILAKLGLGHQQQSTTSANDSSVSGTTPGTATTPGGATPSAGSEPMPGTQAASNPQQAPAQTQTQTATQPMSQVDVAAKMDAMAAQHPEKLNWKTSIVDLLKVLGLDSSLSARQELAKELNCPQDKMGDSAQMNMWLHKAVLQKLAENGGNVPGELLHAA